MYSIMKEQKIFIGWNITFGMYGTTEPMFAIYQTYTKEEAAKKWPPTKKNDVPRED